VDHFNQQQNEDGDPVESGEQAESLAQRFPQTMNHWNFPQNMRAS